MESNNQPTGELSGAELRREVQLQDLAMKLAVAAGSPEKVAELFGIPFAKLYPQKPTLSKGLAESASDQDASLQEIEDAKIHLAKMMSVELQSEMLTFLSTPFEKLPFAIQNHRFKILTSSLSDMMGWSRNIVNVNQNNFNDLKIQFSQLEQDRSVREEKIASISKRIDLLRGVVRNGTIDVEALEIAANGHNSGSLIEAGSIDA